MDNDNDDDDDDDNDDDDDKDDDEDDGNDGDDDDGHEASKPAKKPGLGIAGFQLARRYEALVDGYDAVARTEGLAPTACRASSRAARV